MKIGCSLLEYQFSGLEMYLDPVLVYTFQFRVTQTIKNACMLPAMYTTFANKRFVLHMFIYRYDSGHKNNDKYQYLD